jgi:hypothetical protein
MPKMKRLFPGMLKKAQKQQPDENSIIFVTYEHQCQHCGAILKPGELHTKLYPIKLP